MKIGNIHFSKRLSLLSFKSFKKYWKDGDNEKRTGLSDAKAAKRFGIKVPSEKNDPEKE